MPAAVYAGHLDLETAGEAWLDYQDPTGGDQSILIVRAALPLAVFDPGAAAHAGRTWFDARPAYQDGQAIQVSGTIATPPAGTQDYLFMDTSNPAGA